MENIVSKIEAKVKQKEAQKARLDRLLELKLNDFITDNEIIEVDKEIAKIKSELAIQGKKKIDDIEKYFTTKVLDYEKVKNTEFAYLYDNFVVKNEITMFAAPPASGKSLIAVALSNMFLQQKKVKTVIYFDADNSIATIKNRNIHKLSKQHGLKFKYLHESSCSKLDMLQIIKQLQKTDLTDILIVFDNIKNFMQNGDRDKNKDVSRIMDMLKSLRAAGGSVIFLHHTNKPQKDVNELMYAGSSAWQEDTGNAYILSKNEYKNTFVFKNIKARTGELQNIAFTYNDNHTVNMVNYQTASETEIDEEIRKEIQFILKNDNLNFSQIIKNLQQQGYPYNRIVNVLKNGIDQFWVKQKITENNKSIYILIEYQEAADKNQNTVKELKKLKKSYFRDLNHFNNSQSSQSSANELFVNNNYTGNYYKQIELPMSRLT